MYIYLTVLGKVKVLSNLSKFSPIRIRYFLFHSQDNFHPDKTKKKPGNFTGNQQNIFYSVYDTLSEKKTRLYTLNNSSLLTSNFCTPKKHVSSVKFAKNLKKRKKFRSFLARMSMNLSILKNPNLFKK